jgi:hypothetical protein
VTSEIIIAVAFAVAMLTGAGFAIWTKFLKPIRKWEPSTAFVLGAQTSPQREEPFYSWWATNNNGMGGHIALALTLKVQRTIDVVCIKMTGWTYKSDTPGTDFEPVSIEQEQGDCEDFARVLAMRLIEEGIPAGCMTLGLGCHPRFGWHCILLLNTDQGGYMAEVGNPWFRPWHTNGFVAGGGGPVTGLMAPKQDGYYYDVSAA